MKHFDTATAEISELDVTLIRATNYSDDGYPIRTRIGVIRSNSLTQMGTLTRDLTNYSFFRGLPINVRMIDESIERVPVRQIIKRSQRPGVRSIVMVVGVQSNQYPRAQDIASWFLPHDIPVLIGGFHVSGMMTMIGLTSDLRAAMSKGIVLVAGEVEGGRLATIVEEVIRGKAKPLYNFLDPPPSLQGLPMPRLTKKDFRRSASHFSTIDTGRGCVFTCDFCTIINVQGQVMRFRDPQQVVDFARQCWQDAEVRHCFFTDDNLARNPRWREIFEGLIRLREEEKIPFSFMMQSDLAARKMPGGDYFVLAARAGCNQVFFGVESVNRDNLRSQEKFQNQVSQYRDLVEHCHSLGITCHAGYILGLPFDTQDSIREDIAELQRIGFDSASFYVLAPLPGSKDHQRWWKERRWMHEDFNTYDSAHVAVAPDRMTKENLEEAFRSSWQQFYSTEHMVNVLKGWRHDRWHYWDRISFFSWYLYASRAEGLHPMNCGFWTLRSRNDRRPGFRREPLVPYWWGRLKATTFRLREIIRIFFLLEEVWLRSRPKSRVEEELQELLTRTKQGIADWRELKARELAAMYRKLNSMMPEVKVPSVPVLWLKKRNPFAKAFSRAYVQQVWRRWYLHAWNPLKWLEVWIFEWFHGARFLVQFLRAGK